ncbi:hypothetical protein EGW08_013023, partial [Elysia chlorotica]
MKHKNSYNAMQETFRLEKLGSHLDLDFIFNLCLAESINIQTVHHTSDNNTPVKLSTTHQTITPQSNCPPHHHTSDNNIPFELSTTHQTITPQSNCPPHHHTSDNNTPVKLSTTHQTITPQSNCPPHI